MAVPAEQLLLVDSDGRRVEVDALVDKLRQEPARVLADDEVGLVLYTGDLGLYSLKPTDSGAFLVQPASEISRPRFSTRLLRKQIGATVLSVTADAVFVVRDGNTLKKVPGGETRTRNGAGIGGESLSMTFKNEFERRCFEIAQRALGTGVTIEHNRTIQIESALFPEVASFRGPPAKEIDVLLAELLDRPKVVLLVSCKMLSRPAEPAHVQEWGAVVQTMNRYSDGTQYYGLVISPTGFTAGCEAWATSHNLGIVPPLKGRRLAFGEEAVFRMFERTVKALRTRVQLRFDDLKVPPAFFEFVYRLVADFEGHQEAELDGRYILLPHGWPSSFGEMYQTIGGHRIEDLWAVPGATVARVSGGHFVKFMGDHIEYGSDDEMGPALVQSAPQCRKNIEMEPCSFDLIRSSTVGRTITAADFGGYLEFGLDQRFNLGLHEAGFHLMSTETPVEDHRL
jgi:hypothetical protein